ESADRSAMNRDASDRRGGAMGNQRLADDRAGTSVVGPLHMFPQAADDRVDGHAVGLGPIAQKDAMAQGGMDQGADLLGLDGKPPQEEGPCLRSQDQALRGPQSGTPAHPLVDEVGRPWSGTAR